MAKQRRPAQKPTKSPDPASAVRSPRAVEAAATTRSADAAPVASASSTTPPKRRETYFEAVALYERGLEALQRHAYKEAAHLLESVLRQYPEERELHERVRLYLNICQRQ